ncbi:peptide chain release factor 1 [Leptolyngbya sp. FACHB-36]|uniref:peptide chain release factor 1 n=1 Tax=Leptolyngbya sp. FACHB-36 TaxID=2692808 RepID=UPI00167FEEAB|nr:peptide chain release factor 1 [Leptolyngbya sp. FACHB-36]MBD2020687.1 peptide chain release factor 1 [Leptolyngbya sp. FACHB-36]
MRNPLSRLKYLPWRSLFLAGGLSVLLLAVPIDVLLSLVVQLRDSATAQLVMTLLTSPLGIIITFAIPVGLGALAVLLLERLDRSSISTGSLWGLVLCLLIARLLETALFYGAIQISELELVGIVLGVFWKGRPYWRSFKRW